MLEATDNRYPGGKSLSGFPEWIISHFSDHLWYAEPFAGKGGVYRKKTPSIRSFLIDQDAELLDWWRNRESRSTIVHSGDGIRWCELAAEYGPSDLLIYCDPPYMLETRVKKRLYKHEMSDEDHERLLKALINCRCQVAISGYASDLYESYLWNWHRHEIKVITRGGTLATEVLWTNRLPESSGLAMEYSELGANFRERERINRKASRWEKKFAEMPRREQRAILHRLLDAVK